MGYYIQLHILIHILTYMLVSQPRIVTNGSSEPNLQCTAVVVNEPPQPSRPYLGVYVYPNPASRIFKIRVNNLYLATGKAELKIWDISGNVATDLSSMLIGNERSSRFEIELQASDFTSGVYLVTLNSGTMHDYTGLTVMR